MISATITSPHQHRLFGGPIEDNAQVELTFDAEPLLDEHPLDHLAFGAGLVGHQPHPDHVGRRLFGGVGSLHDFDPTPLAAAAGVNLGLDDDGSTAKADGGRLRVDCVEHDFALRHRHAMCRENCLGLVFVDFHEALEVPIADAVGGHQSRAPPRAQPFNHIPRRDVLHLGASR